MFDDNSLQETIFHKDIVDDTDAIKAFIFY